jgi:hypothetical protein
VNDRWVCKRCFADNEESSAACHRCGLTRGAEASQADQQGWAAQGAPPVVQQQQRAGWTRWIRFWWIPAVLVALAVGFLTQARRDDAGAIDTGGTVSVDELRMGDCFNSGEDEELISDVDGVPCEDPHHYEVFALVTYDAPAFPSDSEMDTVFREHCGPPFASYVGVAYDNSELYASMITPSEETWADGDRSFVCVLYEPEDDDPDAVALISGSMQGANR